MARVLGAGVDERGLESVDERENYCPVFHRAVELIGRRWNGPIIRALLDGAERFGEIRSRIPGLTDRLLAQRLRELEREGVVQRVTAAAGPVPRYMLTPKGQSLTPVIESIAQWAAMWGGLPDPHHMAIRLDSQREN